MDGFSLGRLGTDKGVSRDICYLLGKKWGREPFLDRIDRVDALASKAG